MKQKFISVIALWKRNIRRFILTIIYKLHLKKLSKNEQKKYFKYKAGRKPKAIIYTASVGSYDNLIIPTCLDFDVDYVFFTDNKELLSKTDTVWEFRPLKYSEMDNVRNARWHKTHPHILFPKTEISVWIDSNIKIKTNFLYKKINEFIKSDSKFSISKHFCRNCIYEELESCKNHGKDDYQIMQEQIQFIKNDSYPENAGLFETFILLRKHNDPLLIKLSEDWWTMIKNYSRRDQLSLNYVQWKNNFPIDLIDPEPLRKLIKHFIFWPHKFQIEKDSFSLKYLMGFSYNE